ncbi:RNA methyltransferase [Pseudoalteromonas agarivorans]|uniref:RNA methyltransferase n=1 Tax=Pseudoalteromonas TaxID=53246 RepID=UPI000F765771|nr:MULTISPECIES: RNA methyltransferase [Pseudoalteromonas]MCP4059351.1 RNA methyltransferase [Pseudoalteromonas sp.]AZN34362.1 TrmH family RNA methyltransferase [Pseudoalteromonas sp. Xi13]MCK8096270.1 RNA methyltransferase [Pseudoalteromonas sp. 1CM17D]MCQ8820439.1 RNA methyltransferase [Pseudoalteromonas agarivorans]MCQ8887367.1 RNA methyltransferase [Pseudoalteromonas agarivorans]
MSEFKAVIGLINPKSPTNVGGVLRAAGCYDAKQVFFTGSRYLNAKKFHTDTKNVVERIALTGTDNLLSVKPEGAKVVVIELIEGATALPDFKHPENAFYVFGPEDGSVPKEVLKWCDEVVYVPTIGCMNLAATCNVVLYDRLAKLGGVESSDSTIINSRDTNNKMKWVKA